VERLRPIAEELGLSLAQLALAWTLRQPNVSSAIIGASVPEQVEHNVKASGVTIPDETLATIDKILEQA
jgi:aryl-alcohol dehydrogenase-like predicted oxidoreductase